MAVSHVALNLLSGHKSRHGVDDNDIHSSGADHRLRDLQRLVTAVRLRDVQLVNIHADISCIDRVQRMFRIDKSCNTSPLLHLGDHVQGHRRLTAGLRSVDLHHAASWHAAQPQRQIQA